MTGFSILLQGLASIGSGAYFVPIVVSVAAGGWGLFWIPLRAMEDSGIAPVWGVALFHAVPFSLLIPVVFFMRKKLFNNLKPLFTIGFFLGISMALYSCAYLTTDIVRALLLYYLLPIWGTIFGRVMLGEVITNSRIISIILGLSGMLAIFGIGEEIPWPRNIGDWMALTAGIIWAFGTTLTRGDENCHPLEVTFVYFGWAALTSFLLPLIPGILPAISPSMEILGRVLPWLALVAIALIIPVSATIIWGAGVLNPGRLGVLFLTEISVGVIGASLLTDEFIGVREITGVVLITAAGLCEAVWRPSGSSEP